MSSSRTRFSASALAAAGLLTLQACAGAPNSEQIKRAESVLPTEQFGITVSNAPEQIAIGLHASGLSANHEAALGVLVARWRADGGGPVTLRAPLSGNVALVHRMQEAAAAALARLGVPRERLSLLGYAAAPTVEAAPLLISYERFEAQGPNCSGGWRNLTSTDSNTPYDHFGCSVTANISAQVANPRDFLAPAVETPADDSRREVILGKYRLGLATSSVKDDQASGKVSDVAGGR